MNTLTASERRALELAKEARDMGLDPREVSVGKITIKLGPARPEHETEIVWEK